MTSTKVTGLRIVTLWTNSAAAQPAETDHPRVNCAFFPTERTCDIVGRGPPQPTIFYAGHHLWRLLQLDYPFVFKL